MPGHGVFTEWAKAHTKSMQYGAAVAVAGRYGMWPQIPYLDPVMGGPAAVAYALGGYSNKDHAIAGALGGTATSLVMGYMGM